MYDPSTARFLSKDPLEELGGSPNLYLYCANDPVNKTDPSGNAIGVRYNQRIICPAAGHVSWASDILRDEIFRAYGGAGTSWTNQDAIRFQLTGEMYRRDAAERYSHTYHLVDLYNALPPEVWGNIVAGGTHSGLGSWLNWGTDHDVVIEASESPDAGKRGQLAWRELGPAGIGARVAQFVAELGGSIGDIASNVLQGVIAIAQVALVRVGQLVGAPQEYLDSIELLGKYASDFAARPRTIATNVVDGVSLGFEQFERNFSKHFGKGLREWLGDGLGNLLIQLREGNFGANADSVVTTLSGVVGFTWDELLESAAGEFPPDESGAFAEAISALTAGATQSGFFALSWSQLQQSIEGLNAVAELGTALRSVAPDVFDILIDTIQKAVIKAALKRVFKLAVPGLGLIEAVRLFIDFVRWFIDNRRQIEAVLRALAEAAAFAVHNDKGHAANKFEEAFANSIAPALSGLAVALHVGHVPDLLTSTLGLLGSAVRAPAAAVARTLKRPLTSHGPATPAAAGPDGTPGKRFLTPVPVSGEKYQVWSDVGGTVWLRDGSGAEAVDRKLLPLLGKSVTAKGGGEAGVRGDAQQIEQRVRAVGKAQQEAKSAAPAGGKVTKGKEKGSKHKGVGGSKAGAVAADARQVEKLLKDVARAIEVRGCAVNLKRPHQCFIWDVWVHGSERWFRMGTGRVGMWVRTSGPKGEVAGVEPDAAGWCVVRLRRERADGGWCEADLLRPRSWLGGAGVGSWVPVNLPEMGAHGLFRVLSVEPCPRVEPRPGEGFGLVTGAFRHGACRVLNVWVAGERDAIGVTGLHPFWSADRGGWVPAGSLQDGERVQGLDGPVRVLRVEERGDEPVFNLEVDADHCYRVGEQGILVHNSSAGELIPEEFAKPANTACMPCKPETIDIRGSWRTNATIMGNPRASYVYAVYAVYAGEPNRLLKIGDTENIEDRFSHYVVAAGICKEEYPAINIDFWMYKREGECKTNPSTIAANVAKTLCPKDDSEKCPWDNATFQDRLGRSGPGTPGEGQRSGWTDCFTYTPGIIESRKRGRPAPQRSTRAAWEASIAQVGSTYTALAARWMTSKTRIAEWKHYFSEPSNQ